MAISIPIISTFNGAGVKRAIDDFKKLETTGERAQFALRKAAVPAAAAVAGLATGLGLAAKAAIDDEQAQQLLARQLQATVGANDKAIKSNEEFIKRLSLSAGVADDVLRPAMARLVTGTKDVNIAQQNLQRALDISAATGADTGKVADALAKAYGGNMRALQQLSPEIKNMVKRGADLGDVMAILDRNFKGAADTAADTAAGKFRILKVRLDETKESIGAALLPAIEAVLPFLDSMATFAEKNAPLFAGIATAVGLFGGAVLVATAAVKAWRAISIITTGINYALATSFTAVQVATGVGIATAIAGAAAFMGIKRSLDKAKDSALQYTGAIGTVITSQEELNNYQGPVASRNLEELRIFQAKYQASLISTGTETDKVKDKIKQLAAGLRDKFGEALKTAQDKLADAREEFKTFAAGVSTSIKQAFNFGAAQTTAADNAKALTDALAERAKAQAEVNKLVGTEDTERLKAAQTDLAKAIDAVTAAQKKPMTFFDELTIQANKTKTFGELVNRLLAAGLKEPALQQVLDAGVDAGTAIAKEILGSADGVLKANNLTQEMQTIADGVGKTAAEKFRQAGVTQGQALVDGIQSIVNGYRIQLSSKGLNAKQLKRLSRDFSIDVEFAMSSGITALADGGIVTGPQIALIGEQGPEAVIPLDRMGGVGNVTINVNGGDPEAVVQALRRYMNRYGNIPIRTTAP